MLFALTPLNVFHLTLFTNKEFKGRETGQQIQTPGHSLVRVSLGFWLSLLWLLPFSARAFRGISVFPDSSRFL